MYSNIYYIVFYTSFEKVVVWFSKYFWSYSAILIEKENTEKSFSERY